MRILLLENDSGPLAAQLRTQGCEPEIAADGADLDRRIRSAPCDILVFNLALLDDGYARLKDWQRQGLDAHVLALTSSAAETILALNCGADAAQARPYSDAEVLARVRALVRRRLPPPRPVMRVGDLELNSASHSVKRAGRVAYLTPQQFRLLYCLATHRGALVSRKEVVRWLQSRGSARSNCVSVVMRLLRVRIEQAFNVELIRTVWRHGYMLRVGAAEPATAAGATKAQTLSAPASEQLRSMEYHPSAP